MNRIMNLALWTAAILATPGCSTISGIFSDKPSQPAPQPAPAYVAAPAPEAPDHSSVINAFGEFDNASRPFVSASDASFQKHTACDEGYDADVAVDPSGKWVTYASTRHNEKPHIYLQRTDGSAVIQLTNDLSEDVQPAFSPDGKRIAFASTRAGNWDLYLMDADGKNVQQITSSTAQEMHPSFSPDGSKLVYCALSPKSDQWELWTIDLNSSEKRMIGAGLFPTWSPQKDTNRIAFQRARQRGSRWFSLWTVDLVDGEPRKITEVAVSASAAIVSPSWSPDGKRLAFSTIAAPSAQPRPQRQDVWVVNSDGSGRQRVTDGAGVNLSPCWASDNRIFFLSDRDGHENVWSVKFDPSAAKTATADADEPGRTPANAPNNKGPKTPTAVGSTDPREPAR